MTKPMWNHTRPAAWNVLLAYALACFPNAIFLCSGDACNMAITVDHVVVYSISIAGPTGLLTTFTANAAAQWLALIALSMRHT